MFDPESFRDLVAMVGRAVTTRRGIPRTMGGAVDSARRMFAGLGWSVDPIGHVNRKIGAIGTYRRVGPTCPTSCPYLDAGCFMQHGPGALQQTRASVGLDLWPSLRAEAVGAVYSALTGIPYRGRVSGDLGRTVPDARRYAAALAALLTEVRRVYPHAPAVLGWGYTHHAPHAVAFDVARLDSLGMSTRYSDVAGPRGAIVGDVGTARRLRGKVAAFTCPAALADGVTCAGGDGSRACGLCWSHPTAAVVFPAHGARARKARAASPHGAR